MTRPEWVLGPGAVFVGGDVRGPVTVNVVTGTPDYLRHAIFDPEPLPDSLDLARFTGREWLIERIDNYIARHRKGYVVVRAEAGVGKSALAAKLVWTRPCAYHFTLLEGARSPVEARRSLAAQLILAWQLVGELAPGDTFPQGAGRPDWLVKVVKKAAERRNELRPGAPLVLVVDGLDEASGPLADDQDTGIPLGLPHPESLPDGVFIVATTRFTKPIGRLSDRDSWHTIEVDGPENLEDMRRYLAAAVEGPAAMPDLAARLAAHGVAPQSFAQELAGRCRGVWIYLRYVLDAIREGQRSPADVDSLPAGLAGYYVEQVQQWRRAGDWVTAGRPALAVLAALRRAATLTELAEFTAAGKDALREWLDERLRPFLDVTRDWERRSRYSIRHQSLRDLFTPADGEDSDPWASTREDLHDALLDAHTRVAAAARRVGRRGADASVLPYARHEAIGHLFEAVDHARFAREGEDTKERLADFTEIAKLVINDESEEGEAAALLLLAVLARHAEDCDEPTLWETAEFVEEPSFYSGIQLVSYLSNVIDNTRPGHLFAAVLAEEFQQLDEDFVERMLARMREAIRARLTEAESGQRDDLCLKLGAHFHGITDESDTAERYYRECLVIRRQRAEALPGNVEAQLDLSVPYEKLAQLLAQYDERLAEAWHLYEQAVEIKERALGPGHSEATTTANEMSSLLSFTASRLETTGRLDQARPLYERALQIRETRLGADHPDTATSLNNLAVLLHNEGSLDQARPLYERALQIRETRLGADHPDTATSLSNLAVLLHNEGKLDQARPLYERALQIRSGKHGLGLYSEEGIDAQYSLALLLHDQGDLLGARPLYQRVRRVWEKTSEADPLKTASALGNLAVVLLELGDLGGAQAMCERALDIRKAKLEPGHVRIADSLNDITQVLHDQADLAGARSLAQQALEICRQQQEPDHAATAYSIYRLAWVLHDEGRLEEARPLFEQAVEICERELGPGHLQTEYRRYGLARLLHSLGQLDAARELFAQCLQTCERLLPPGHPDIAYDLTGLAGVLRDQARLDEARAMLQRALQIREEKLGPSHRTAQTLHDLAGVLREQGDPAGARAMLQRALQIREEKLGPSHPHTVLSRAELAGLVKTGDA